MPTPNEHKLKIALARMLPDKIFIKDDGGGQFSLYWHGGRQHTIHSWWDKISDTELLHICWLVEQTLSGDEYTHFLLHLHKMTNSVRTTSATFEKRAQALAKVKGVEV